MAGWRRLGLVSTTFEQIIERAMAVRVRYVAEERRRYGREWATKDLMLGFVRDVGNLARLVQAADGIRDVPDFEDLLGHELSDCLWSVIVLASALGVDLEESFARTMDEIDERLTPQNLPLDNRLVLP
jgi:MazG nucleotide pyrophosphohydrolase domain.